MRYGGAGLARPSTHNERVTAPPPPASSSPTGDGELGPPTAAAWVPRRVTFLMQNVHGGGGVARTVIGLANTLAESHDVTILSVVSGRKHPRFDIDPRVRVVWVLKSRELPRRRVRPRKDALAPGWLRALDSQPSSLIDSHDEDGDHTRLTDLLLMRALGRLGPGILVSTRPTLHRAAARWSPPWVVRIAQDHLNYIVRSRNPPLMDVLDAASHRLDAFVTLTHGDEQDYTARWTDDPKASLRIVTVPNASPFAIGEPGALDSRRIVTAGRLEARKGFDRVIRAFAEAAGDYPDWQLQVYGSGEAAVEQQLHALIDELGVGGQVHMMGFTDEFDAVLRGASFYAMGSTYEGLPMVLLEAQASGLPVVAYDCPRGPADLIEDGVNGRLVDDGDHATYVAALRQLMGDDEVRVAMGAAARRTAASYTRERIADRWSSSSEELTAARRWFRPRQEVSARHSRESITETIGADG